MRCFISCAHQTHRTTGKAHAMSIKIEDGQCGLCAHFGENDAQNQQLIQIRLKHEAPEAFRVECGHPEHAPLHLVVTPLSGCAGFVPAPATR
jgi:hypothetical protein